MKVLIAVDDGPESQDALAFAKDTLPDDAEIVVLNVARHAVTPYGTVGVFSMGAYNAAVLPGTTKARLDDELDAAAERTAHRAAVAVDADAERIAHGDAGEAICRVAAEEAADLIVLGTRDKGRWSRLWFGSVSDHVVHHAPCPVTVVRH